jgi:hypothetical protein
MAKIGHKVRLFRRLTHRIRVLHSGNKRGKNARVKKFPNVAQVLT